jgi:glutaredoxin 3
MNDRPVVLYATSGCATCQAARVFLRDRGVVFADIEVTADARFLRELVRVAGHAVVPTIVVGDDVQVGWDASRVEDMLANPLPAADDDLKIVFPDDPPDGPPDDGKRG